MQEVLGKVAFPGNDRQARLLRVIRCESRKSVVPFGTGQSGVYPRGVNESGSLYTPFDASGAQTVTAVPHPRITSLYFVEQVPGSGATFLYGDHENEVTYMAHGLRAKNIGTKSPQATPSEDHTTWEIK
jgi:hypothetical protein